MRRRRVRAGFSRYLICGNKPVFGIGKVTFG
jgi:hypothetical protein